MVVRPTGDGSELRVAVVHNLLRGGALRRLQSQLQNVDALTHEFTLSSATALGVDATVVPVVQKAPTSSRVLRPVPRHLDVERLARAWARCFEEVVAWEPDVIWLNPCHLLQAPALPSGINIPTFYYCDEPRRADYDAAARATTNPVTRPLYAVKRRRERHLDRAAVARIDQLATNSSWTARRIQAAYGREADVVACGVPADFTPDVAATPTHVMSVGTLIPSKGHDLAITAVAKSTLDLPFVVVAPRADPAEVDRLRALAAKVGVELTIRVGISDVELRELYRRAFATIYLARDEPLGLVSLEAQACGSPVVVSDEGGLPETLRDGVTGWAVPRDAGAAASRLNELADPSVRSRLSRAAAAHGAQMSWSRSGREVEAALRSLAGRQHAEVAA